MNIEWKEINPDYIISSDGRVGSRKRGSLHFLKPLLNDGYRMVLIHEGSGGHWRKVHHLVAEAFIGPRPTPRHQINHKNGIRTDNRDHNLEWVTQSQNMRHRRDVLKHDWPRGEACGASKITEAMVREIRARCLAGEVQEAVAADYGITQKAVSKIICGGSWGWLGD